MIRYLLVVFLCLNFVSCSADAPIADNPSGSSSRSKLDTMLTLLHEEVRLFQLDNSSQVPFKSKLPNMPIIGDDIIIDAIAEHDGTRLGERLQALGATHISIYKRNVSCHFPIAQIDELARLADLKFARPSIAATRPTTN